MSAEVGGLTEAEPEALAPFIWGAWIGVATGREADYSRELRATVEHIIADRDRAAEKRGAERAWDEGVRQAARWLQADYEPFDGPEWRERGVQWIYDRLAEHDRDRSAP